MTDNLPRIFLANKMLNVPKGWPVLKIRVVHKRDARMTTSVAHWKFAKRVSVDPHQPMIVPVLAAAGIANVTIIIVSLNPVRKPRNVSKENVLTDIALRVHLARETVHRTKPVFPIETYVENSPAPARQIVRLA